MITFLYIALVFFLVFANGFFVASEFALVGVRRSRVEMIAQSGNAKAKRLLRLLGNLNGYISATQLGITMASLGLGWVGEPVFAHILEAPLKGRVSEVTLHTLAFAIAFTIITFLHIVLGELAPKTLALERAEKVALAISWPMEAFYRVFRWPIRLLDWAGIRTVRLFGLQPSGDHASVYTEDELRHLIDISQKSGHVAADERRLIHRVFEFSEVNVREAMVPRTQIQALTATASLAETREAFRSSGFSRLPVYRDNFDDIVGVLYRKDVDMGRLNDATFRLDELVRAAVFIPETVSAGEALKQMQATRVHFVFVVNEHGGAEGILTLEDLLEEIVGEIDDEFDEETKSQIKRDQESFVLDGMLAVRAANQQLALALPERDGYTTIAGFLMTSAGRILNVGDEVDHESGTFRVERVDGRRILRVRFQPSKRVRHEKAQKEVELSIYACCAFLWQLV
ncbi:MAG TPA: hemolysin family protein [Pyrinomonadaceae bacterium]|nr:hemolysin family protein [Pyrinomonadaceae bacterium]